MTRLLISSLSLASANPLANVVGRLETLIQGTEKNLKEMEVFGFFTEIVENHSKF